MLIISLKENLLKNFNNFNFSVMFDILSKIKACKKL